MTRARSGVDVGRTLGVASAHLRQGEHAAARHAIRSVLAEWPDQPDALHLLGLWQHEQGDSQAAVASIRAAISAWPAGDSVVAGVWNNLGNVLLESGHGVDAVEAYRASLAIDPANAPTWGNIATLLRRLGRPDEAVIAARAGVDHDPTDPRGWFALARALIETDDVAGGLHAHANAVALGPVDGVGRDQVVRSLVLLGRLDDAAELYRDWLRSEPDDPVLTHQLAAVEANPEARPERASAAYVETVFDTFATSFDVRLAGLGYRAPELVVDVILRHLPNRAAPVAADLGCGTGLVGRVLRPHVADLTGCDLSVGMLELAERRGVYDRLFRVDLVEFLRNEVARFDAITCADTLCYLGDLAAVAAGAAVALRPGGVFGCTVEALPIGSADHWTLTPSGRYAHSDRYVRAVFESSGLHVVELRRDTLRTEAGLPVDGLVMLVLAPIA